MNIYHKAIFVNIYIQYLHFIYNTCKQVIEIEI